MGYTYYFGGYYGAPPRSPLKKFLYPPSHNDGNHQL